MYDPLTSTYTFACPHGRAATVALSSFRELDCVPGTSHPAVYRVCFACGCGGEHDALVSQDELDCAPLGVGARGTFLNLMTRRNDAVADELQDVASVRIRMGEWPWSFYCFPEDRPRPVTPSAFAAIAPSAGSFGIAVRCPVCSSLSVNLVSRAHVDVPFWNDDNVGVLDHVVLEGAIREPAAFRDELANAHFEERRIDLDA